MAHYTIIQWLFFFYYYCFVGWCWESTYVSVKEHRLINRGFLRGPFLPIYGCGAIMMLVVSMPFQGNPVLIYLAGCVGATILEYVTGVTMEALFKIRYWDYSNQRFNYKGHICLSSSLAWGFFTIMMTQFIQKPIENSVLSIPENVLRILTWIVSIIFVADVSISFKAAMDLRDILVRMEKIKKELELMQKRLDVMIALADSEFTAKREGLVQSLDQRKDQIMANYELQKEQMGMHLEDLAVGVGGRLENLKKRAIEMPSAYLDSVREEIGELRGRYQVYLAMKENMNHMLDFFKRDMIRSNPGMTSVRFKEYLEELKSRIGRK